MDCKECIFWVDKIKVDANGNCTCKDYYNGFNIREDTCICFTDKGRI